MCFTFIQSLMIGLVHDQPNDPLAFIEKCMNITRNIGGTKFVVWDSFIGSEFSPGVRSSGMLLFMI